MSLHPPFTETAHPHRIGPWALALTGLLALALALWGLALVYQDRMERHRHQAELGLQAISHLQAQSLADWRAQRLTDAMALSDDALFAQAVVQWLRNPSQDLERMVEERLRILQEHENYTAVHLVDTQGQLLLTPGGSTFGRLPEPEQQALQGATVLELGLGPANRDPARWERPDEYDLFRPKKTNLAFGFGTHRCLGMNVARVEINRGINALLDHFPNLRLDPEARAPFMTGGLEQQGVSGLPVLLR